MKTITGQWPEAPLGTLELALEHEQRIGGTTHSAPRYYKLELGLAGEIMLDRRIWGNDELMPEGSKYRMTIFDQLASILFGPLHFSLCGPSPLNLNRLIQSRVASGFNTFAIQSAYQFGQPNPGELLLLYVSPFQQVFPPNFASPQSYGSAGTSAAAPAVFTVLVNGSTIGTVTFLANGLITFATAGFLLNPGDRLEVTNPDPPDAALSDVALTLVSTRLT